MFSEHYQIIDIIDKHCGQCLLVMTRYDRPIIQYTKQLFSQYAIRHNMNMKIYISYQKSESSSSSSLCPFIDILQQFAQIIMIMDDCCINPQTINLFNLIPEQTLGAVLCTDNNNKYNECAIIRDKLGFHLSAENYIDYDILIIDRSHQSLFQLDYTYYKSKGIDLCDYHNYRPMINYIVQKHALKKIILDAQYGNHDLKLSTDSKWALLNHDHITHQHIVVTDKLFYIQQIVQIYAHKCYLTPDIHVNMQVIDDISEEIIRLKKIHKSKFNMLVFVHPKTPEIELWTYLTQYKVTCLPIDDKWPTVCQSFTPDIPKAIKDVHYNLIVIGHKPGIMDHEVSRVVCFCWADMLSQRGTIIYVSDINLLLERYCFDKYFKNDKYQHLNTMENTYKIIKKCSYE